MRHPEYSKNVISVSLMRPSTNPAVVKHGSKCATDLILTNTPTSNTNKWKSAIDKLIALIEGGCLERELPLACVFFVAFDSALAVRSSHLLRRR